LQEWRAPEKAEATSSMLTRVNEVRPAREYLSDVVVGADRGGSEVQERMAVSAKTGNAERKVVGVDQLWANSRLIVLVGRSIGRR
jgi:hypothetical protein